MKDPAFLFYSSDFLTGTMFMDNEQVGKFIRLICAQHQKGRLTEKDMLKICNTYDEDIFCKFTKDSENLFYNVRLEEEINKRKAYSESRRNNRKKKEDMNNISLSYVKHMENENENENEIKNINEIPTFETFESFLKSKYENFEPYRENWKLKYESWVENKWKDGNNNKIKNWKTKVLNTIPYIKEKQSTLGVKHLSQKHNLF